MIVRKISTNEAGQRFDKYLRKLLRAAPDSFLYKMLRKKNIVLNGKKADGREMLACGDEVKFFLADETFEKFSGTTEYSGNREMTNSVNGNMIDQYSHAFQALNSVIIVYEDDNVLVADKPAGVLSQKSAPGDISVNEWLIGYLLSTGVLTPAGLATFKPSVCNRLDRNTSGMVVCGKSLLGSQYLSRIIKEKTLEKYYYCLVVGTVVLNRRVTGYLYKDHAKNKVTVFNGEADVPVAVRRDADYIDTLFRTVKTVNNVTLLEARLYTGKTHQIRAQLAALGCPIIGDGKYGSRAVNQKYEAAGIKSQLLHAHKLVFPVVPESEQALASLSGLTLECGLPDTFARLIKE